MDFVLPHRRPSPSSFPRGIVAAASVLFTLVAGPPVGARTDVQKAPLQIDDIFAREPLIGRLPAAITWAPDGSRFLYTLPGGEPGGPVGTHVYTPRTHRDRVFFAASANGKGSRPAPEFVWSPDSRRLAYLDAGALWVIGADGTGRKRLAADADDPQWSPDARRIGYVHAGDVYAVPAAGGAPARYSSDGSMDTVNGDPDWVYSEELDMRHAFAWSPDSTRIAYLRFDDRPVAPFPIIDFLAPVNTVERQRYPLAGGRNPIVTLRVGRPGGAARDLYTTKTNDDYLASVGWTPAGEVGAVVLDRSQRRLRYLEFGSPATTVLLTERDPAWVDFSGAPRWLRDRRHALFLSDRGGQTALYLLDRQTGATRRLTRGFAVSRIAGVDEVRRIAFVEAAFPTRRDSTVLLVPLAGGTPRPLANGDGFHRFVLAPNAHQFVRIDSAFGVPPVYTLGSTMGGGLTPFARAVSLTGRHFGGYTLGQIDSPAGKLDTWTIEPPDFNPAKEYPVVMYVYGGPAAPTTQNVWDGDLYLYHQALAQRGFIVFSIDGAGSQIDRAGAVRRLFRRLGPASLDGQLAGVAYLKTLPYVDPERIGIWGWSFGGYETAYAMTHAPGVWRVGEAVAPVTDWRYYDTIYTERYMGRPLENAAAYRASSPLDAAGAFEGRLLISHGTADDNVHLANSVSFLQALLLSGKQVDFMVYPRKTHGISGIAQRRHLFSHMLEYWLEHL